MTRIARLAIFTTLALALALAMSSCAPLAQEEQRGSKMRFAGMDFWVPVHSLIEHRFLTVVQQEHDFSCGSAALATLLTYHYRRPFSEAKVFAAMWETGDQQRIRTMGFSLLDMKSFLASRGIPANGYRVPLAKLVAVSIPAIVLIDVDGYKHFVVVKGIEDGRVLVGDPARGVMAMDSDEFEKMWNGIVFVIGFEEDVGRNHFNKAEEWSLLPRSPIRDATYLRDLQAFTLSLPATNEL